MKDTEPALKWENDPGAGIVKDAKYWDGVNLGLFRYFNSQMMTPEQACPKDAALREKYAEYLKNPT